MTDSTTRGSILIVDDELRYLPPIAGALQPDYRVELARSSTEALALMQQTPFDVIIAAHATENGSGLGLLREALSRRHPAIRVVATEVEHKRILAAAINEARVSYILHWPLAPDVLREVIDGLLELRVRQRTGHDKRPVADTPSSVKEGFTGVMPLPAFFRQVQKKIGAAGAEAAVLGAELDDPNQVLVEDVTHLRMLSACVREASTGVPDSVVSRTGNRILALLPGCSDSKAIALAKHARANFARAVGTASTMTASYGVACFPRHASDPLGLLDRVDEAIARAQRQGFGLVAECMPRLCVIGPLTPFRHVIDVLARREDLVMRVFEQPVSLAELMAKDRPSLLLINLQASHALLTEVHRLAASPEHQALKVIFATAKEGSAQSTSRAAGVRGAALITDPTRFTQRVVEAVSGALGIKVRRYFRLEARIPITVVLGPETTLERRIPGALVNLSESGALVSLPERVRAGDQLRLRFEFGGVETTVGSTVVRIARLEPACECAVRFENLDEVQFETITRFVSSSGAPPAPIPLAKPKQALPAAPLRANIRYLPSKFLHFKVRLRRHDKASRWYLKVVNLSPGGLLALAPKEVTPELNAGEWVEVVLMDPRGSVRCTAQVVRRAQSDAGRWQVAIRFIQLDRRSRLELGRMLAQCHEAGRVAAPGP